MIYIHLESLVMEKNKLQCCLSGLVKGCRLKNTEQHVYACFFFFLKNTNSQESSCAYLYASVFDSNNVLPIKRLNLFSASDKCSIKMFWYVVMYMVYLSCIAVDISYTTCRFFNTYRPYSNVEYNLVWRGKDLDETESCNIRFKPFDEDHKICIESQTVLLEDCGIKMMSYDGKYAYHVKKVNF